MPLTSQCQRYSISFNSCKVHTHILYTPPPLLCVNNGWTDESVKREDCTAGSIESQPDALHFDWGMVGVGDDGNHHGWG